MPKKKARKSPNYDDSHLEQMFYRYWCSAFIHKPTDRPVLQHVFHPVRQWRFDFCWPHKKLALEIQGHGPGHCSRQGQKNDADKCNAALLLGWKIAYFTSHHLQPETLRDSCNIIAQLLGNNIHATHQTGPRPYLSVADRRRRFGAS